MENTYNDDMERKRFLELYHRAEVTDTYTYTDFHTAHGMAIAKSIAGDEGIRVWGGYEGAERCIIRFGFLESTGYDEPFPIDLLLIRPKMEKYADRLSHRDYLGALMNLGIERKLLGDIIVFENRAYVFSVERMSKLIISDIDKVKHTPVECEMIDALPEEAMPRKKELSVNVSSLRLDGIVSHVFNISRSNAKALFSNEKISAGGVPVKSPGFEPAVDDIISVAGHGKFVYKGEKGITKKGNHVVMVEKYI